MYILLRTSVLWAVTARVLEEQFRARGRPEFCAVQWRGPVSLPFPDRSID